MGSSQSIEIPGGGTEGYHVLRVSEVLLRKSKKSFFDTSSFCLIRSKTAVPVRKLDWKPFSILLWLLEIQD